MGCTKTGKQIAEESRAIKKALPPNCWLRPGTISDQCGLNLATVVATLRRLQLRGDVDRREYYVPRIHHGKDRTRQTVRLIVEYRRRQAPKRVKYPAWLMPEFSPPQVSQKRVHRAAP